MNEKYPAIWSSTVEEFNNEQGKINLRRIRVGRIPNFNDKNITQSLYTIYKKIYISSL